MDAFYVTKDEFKALIGRIDSMEEDLNQKIREIDYDDETESQQAESIADVGGELSPDEEEQKDEVKSRASLHNIKSNE